MAAHRTPEQRGTAQLASLFAALLVAGACSSPGPPVPRLAMDQVLDIPVSDDPASFDPIHASIQLPSSTAVARNLFDGLYRLDQNAQIQPDIATSPPEVSPDQKMFTFHLRPEARFWNGDAADAQDFIYSWSRAVFESGLADSGLYAIDGVDAVANAKTLTMLSGLSAPDPHVLVARLSAPAGYWPATLANPETFVVDPKVVEGNRKDWASTPESLVGTGPFKWSQHVAGQSADFVPVTDWWGGPTGYLKTIHLEVVPRVQDTERDYSMGKFGLVGLGTDLYDPPVYAKWKGHSKDWDIFPGGATYSLLLNANSAPLQGQAGRDGRAALSEAIDRVALAKEVCGDVRLCTPATGGPIAKGMVGYLGDGADSNAIFDAARARRTYQSWDPDGSKVHGLAYTFYGSSGGFPDGVEERNAAALHQMWKQNLGIDVLRTELTDRTQLFRLVFQGKVQLSRIGWWADYNSPQNWYETRGQVTHALDGSAQFDRLVITADGQPFADSSAYDAVGRLVIQDVLYAPLLYFNFVTVVQPWVRGASDQVWIDAPWKAISILSH